MLAQLRITDKQLTDYAMECLWMQHTRWKAETLLTTFLTTYFATRDKGMYTTVEAIKNALAKYGITPSTHTSNPHWGI